MPEGKHITKNIDIALFRYNRAQYDVFVQLQPFSAVKWRTVRKLFSSLISINKKIGKIVVRGRKILPTGSH